MRKLPGNGLYLYVLPTFKEYGIVEVFMPLRLTPYCVYFNILQQAKEVLRPAEQMVRKKKVVGCISTRYYRRWPWC